MRQDIADDLGITLERLTEMEDFHANVLCDLVFTAVENWNHAQAPHGRKLKMAYSVAVQHLVANFCLMHPAEIIRAELIIARRWDEPILVFAGAHRTAETQPLAWLALAEADWSPAELVRTINHVVEEVERILPPGKE